MLSDPSAVPVLDPAVVANVVPAPRRATDPAPISPAPVAEVGLDQLAQLVVEEQRLKEELAALVDRLAASGVGWPVIAAVLGVSRQAARQAHRRRHAHDQHGPARPAGARLDP